MGRETPAGHKHQLRSPAREPPALNPIGARRHNPATTKMIFFFFFFSLASDLSLFSPVLLRLSRPADFSLPLLLLFSISIPHLSLLSCPFLSLSPPSIPSPWPTRWYVSPSFVLLGVLAVASRVAAAPHLEICPPLPSFMLAVAARDAYDRTCVSSRQITSLYFFFFFIRSPG